MNESCLKLTSYFGERQRAEHAYLADALLDLYGRRRLAASVLLRGIDGYGPANRLRTDRLLTLSEDLPIAAVAVDTRPRIEALLDDVLAIEQRGLVTLEPARMLTHPIGAAELPPELPEATKLTVYLGRHERAGRTPAFAAVCDLLHHRGVAGATALLGVDGTFHGARERARFFSRNPRVPMLVTAIGDGPRIAQALPELEALLERPLLTVERVRICKREGQLIEPPHAVPGRDEHGLELWQKLTLYTSEAAHHDGQPVHRTLVRRLRRAGGAGATVLRGVWGFHGDHPPHGDRLLQLGRHVPVVTVVIDTPERIARWFEIVDELTAERGLVTSEIVRGLLSGTPGRCRAAR